MVKNLKRILAIVLSFTTLFFKGPVCFSMQPPLPQPLIPPFNGSAAGGGNDIEVSYAARKVHDADLGRSLRNNDHSKVTVPVVGFFLYPPKSVKELFEIKDKSKAFLYRDKTMHTDVARRVKNITSEKFEDGAFLTKKFIKNAKTKLFSTIYASFKNFFITVLSIPKNSSDFKITHIKTYTAAPKDAGTKS